MTEEEAPLKIHDIEDDCDNGARSQLDESGNEVYLLHRNMTVFKAKVMPFAAEKERIVHCKLLKDDEDRYIILKVYQSNMSESFFDEDLYSVVLS